MLRTLVVATLAISLNACASVERLALPKPSLLSENFAFQTPVQTEKVNYATYDQFLTKYWSKDANGIARVDYKAVGATDRANLASFVDQLQQVNPGNLERNDQLAYWINLYNAQTIRVVLDAYPVGSIREIKDGPLSIGPWNRKDVMVNGTALSLNDIEHRIIRPTFNEPRIHYALNCAAASCPNLAPQAWRGAGLDAALEAAELSYLADDRGISIDEDGRVTASKIYIWFREDFGANQSEVLARLISKSPEPKAAALQARGRIDRYQYDWSLNEAQ
ncbi:MAG: DUF547 domain-containing protein [Paracoccaceae bacterium]